MAGLGRRDGPRERSADRSRSRAGWSPTATGAPTASSRSRRASATASWTTGVPNAGRITLITNGVDLEIAGPTAPRRPRCPTTPSWRCTSAPTAPTARSRPCSTPPSACATRRTCRVVLVGGGDRKDALVRGRRAARPRQRDLRRPGAQARGALVAGPRRRLPAALPGQPAVRGGAAQQGVRLPRRRAPDHRRRPAGRADAHGRAPPAAASRCRPRTARPWPRRSGRWRPTATAPGAMGEQRPRATRWSTTTGPRSPPGSSRWSSRLPERAGPVGGRAKRALDLAVALPARHRPDARSWWASPSGSAATRPGPALFRQQRIGYAGPPLHAAQVPHAWWSGAEGMGAGLAVAEGDDRITGAGARPAPPVAGRAAPAVEHRARRHEPGGPAPDGGVTGGALRRPSAPAPAGAARA